MNKKLVMVFWRDIASISSTDNSGAWLTEEEAAREADKLYNHQYISVGYLVENNPKYIVVAATTDNDKDNPLYSDASMIMKSVVIKIVPLR
jgi:hypothetical protein